MSGRGQVQYCGNIIFRSFFMYIYMLCETCMGLSLPRPHASSPQCKVRGKPKRCSVQHPHGRSEWSTMPRHVSSSRRPAFFELPACDGPGRQEQTASLQELRTTAQRNMSETCLRSGSPGLGRAVLRS